MKFNVFLILVFFLWFFLGWGFCCEEEIEVGSRCLNFVGDFLFERMFEIVDCDFLDLFVFLLRFDVINL